MYIISLGVYRAALCDFIRIALFTVFTTCLCLVSWAGSE